MISPLREVGEKLGLLKIVHALWYFEHLKVTMWYIKKLSLHASYTGIGSLEMRKECVRCVSLFLPQIMITLSLFLLKA